MIGAILGFLVFFVKVHVALALAPLIWLYRTLLPSRKDVSNEIILITGGGMGMGRLMALTFAKLDATVVIWDINQGAMDAVVDEIKALGRGKPVLSYVVDVSKKQQVYDTASKMKADVGDVTMLINNAGLVNPAKILSVPDDRVQLLMDVNATAHLWTIKAFLPAMLAKNHGHITTIASGAGLFGMAGMLDYCASKFAAVGLHEAVTMDMVAQGKNGIKTTVVCPYFVKTGMFEGAGGRFDWLITPLTPEYATDRIVDAIRTDSEMLIMPRICYVFLVLKGILPTRIMIMIADYFDMMRVMDNFVGHAGKKQQ